MMVEGDCVHVTCRTRCQETGRNLGSFLSDISSHPSLHRESLDCIHADKSGDSYHGDSSTTADNIGSIHCSLQVSASGHCHQLPVQR